MFARRIGIGSLVTLVLLTTAATAQEKADNLSLSAQPIKTFGTNSLRHGSRIQCLLFAPKGSFPEAADQPLLIAGGGNDPIRLWNADTGQPVKTLPIPWTQSLAWCSKSGTLVAGNVFRLLSAIRPSTPAESAKHDSAPAAIRSVAIAPGGKPILGGCQDGQLLVFTPSSKKAVYVLGHKGEVNAVAAAASGKLFASGGSDRAIILWRLSAEYDSLDKDKTLMSPGMVNAVVFTPDAQTLISAGDDRAIRLWDVASGKLAHTLEGHKDTIAALALSADGKTLVSAGYDEALIVWNLEKREKVRTIPIRIGDADALALSPDAKLIAVGGGNNAIRLFETDTGKERFAASGPQAPLAKVVFAADLNAVAALTNMGEVHHWDAKTAGDAKTWRIATAPFVQQDVFLLRVPGEPSFIAASSALAVAEIREMATGKIQGTIPLPAGDSLTGAAFSPSGKTLALAFRSGLLQLVDWPSKEVRAKAKAAGPIQCVAFSPEAPVLATATAGKVQLWDAPTGGELRSFTCKEDTPDKYQPAVADLAFSSDGKTLAVSGYDAIIRLVDWTTGKLITECDGHTSAATSLAFAPDGRTFASASFDKTVRLWEAFTGKPIETFKGHEGPVSHVIFAPTGRTLYSTGADARVIAWAPSALILEAAPAKLDSDQRRQLWDNLAAENGKLGQTAAWRFIAVPKETPEFLATQLYLVDPAKVDRLFADLDAKEFRTREKATVELAKYGRWMEGRLETAMKNPPSLEVERRVERLLGQLKTGNSLTLKQERLRTLRVMQILEQLGDPAAVKVLTDLARGAAEPELQREAELSLRRLQKRAT